MAVTTFANLNGTRVLQVGRIFAGGDCKIRQLRPFILTVYVPEIFDLLKKSAITRCTRVPFLFFENIVATPLANF